MNQDQIIGFIGNYLNDMQEQQVSEESIQLIREKINIIPVRSKGNLLIPGEVCRNIYIVIYGGFVCRYVHEKTGEAKTINFYLQDLHPVTACVDSYFTQTPTHCELKAISDSAVVALPKEVVDRLVSSDKYFAQFYQEIVIRAMVEENEIKTKLIAYSSKEKYEFILQEMPSVIQAVPSKYIAEFCGISPEWLSKLKRQS